MYIYYLHCKKRQGAILLDERYLAQQSCEMWLGLSSTGIDNNELMIVQHVMGNALISSKQNII